MSKFLKVCRAMNVTRYISLCIALVNESKQAKPFHFFFEMSAPKLI